MKKKSLYWWLKKEYANVLNMGIQINALSFYNKNKFDAIIKDNEKAAKFIIFNSEFPESLVSFNRNPDRACHTIINFLLGNLLINSLHIPDEMDREGCRFYSLWLYTSLFHDYGYFCEETTNEKLLLSSITNEYDLLSDKYQEDFLDCLNGFSLRNPLYFSYKYETVKNYFPYSIIVHQNTSGTEHVDHGIVGGCLAFKKYCEHIQRYYEDLKPSSIITKCFKIACYTTAMHNMFKSEGKTTDGRDLDKEYVKYGLDELLSTEPPRITTDNMLLLLLSIVDTIEPTKRFLEEKGKRLLKKKKVLKKTILGVDNNTLTLDFTKLYRYLRKRNECYLNDLNKHVRNVKNLNYWTTVKVSHKNEYIIQLEV